MSATSWRACTWQRILPDGRTSFRGKSWRRVCSNRSVTWSLVYRNQFFLLQGCIRFCRSRNGTCSETFSMVKRRKIKFPEHLRNYKLSDVYLWAVNFLGQGPSSISTSKVAHVTVNRNLLWTKHQLIHLTLRTPVDGRELCIHFYVKRRRRKESL